MENLHGKSGMHGKSHGGKLSGKFPGSGKSAFLAENLENLEIKPLFYAENLHYYVENMEKSTLLCR